MREHLSNPLFWLQTSYYLIVWCFVGFAFWFLAFFSPTHIVRTELYIDGDKWTLNNYSYKTLLSEVLCGKPSSSIIIFEDPELSFVSNVLDNATGYGSGDERVRKWTSDGTIPNRLPKGVMIAVHKRLIYPCLGVNKEVDTEPILFFNK